MATARKLDTFTCDAEYEEKMLESAPAPYVPTDNALKDAKKLLGIKASKQRKVRRDLFDRVSKPYDDESGALLGHC